MKNLKLKRPLVFFDLETTGLNINKDRIVQIAAIKFFPNKKERVFESLINPTIPIEQGASEVHGIYHKDILDKPTFNFLADEIFNFFKDSDFAGYNILNFDIPLLYAEFNRCGLKFTHSPLFIDCFRIFKKQLPHTLEGALKYYTQQSLVDAHNALADVQATVNVFLAQQKYIEQDTVEDIFNEFRDKNTLDIAGKLKKNGQGFTVLNFGKYKGHHIKEVPHSYFKWLHENNILANDAWGVIREVFRDERN